MGGGEGGMVAQEACHCAAGHVQMGVVGVYDAVGREGHNGWKPR